MGVAIRTTASSCGSGRGLHLHIIPADLTVARRYYAGNIGRFPKIRARVMPGGGHCGRWTWMQDLDIPHNAKETQASLKKGKTRTPSWAPKGKTVTRWPDHLRRRAARMAGEFFLTPIVRFSAYSRPAARGGALLGFICGYVLLAKYLQWAQINTVGAARYAGQAPGRAKKAPPAI